MEDHPSGVDGIAYREHGFIIRAQVAQRREPRGEIAAGKDHRVDGTFRAGTRHTRPWRVAVTPLGTMPRERRFMPEMHVSIHQARQYKAVGQIDDQRHGSGRCTLDCGEVAALDGSDTTTTVIPVCGLAPGTASRMPAWIST